MVIITSILLEYLSTERLRQTSSFFIRLLLNQGSDEVTLLKWNFKIDSSLIRFSFILIIIIWSQSASILTKGFTGNLLNTYFNIKFQSIVENVEDIYHNKQIEIASDPKGLRWLLQKENQSLDLINNIENRVVDFIKKNNYKPDESEFVKEYYASKMIKGETVIMLNTVRCKYFIEYFSTEKLDYQVSDKKYGPNHFSFLVKKNHPAANIFKRL